ncbi:pyrroloquinoline quinone biosynthesis protein PqqF [Azomonas macrocytogenes]|uniref:Coenzyme PQQ synthesis protein F n=1 Tax=Azomonas macrocytogenes TaxID=69962 RepID=A0A839T511_AZOMA|nr:pyrroloquinoline quinone biosynthesis protein PqqF [Azomonas macrocytogenes]MBB3104532.1 coenzyme PQQ biosynthesis probable peptidase PqqF [Azomonas macrocytogenes]
MQLHETLANGCAIQVLRQTRATVCALIVEIAAGSHDEPAAWPGLAHFLEHLLFLGGEDFSGEQRLMPFVQACGGRVNARTGPSFTRYFFEVPSIHFEQAGQRLLDMLVNPRLDYHEQLRERDVLDAEYSARAADAGQLGQSALLAVVAPAHPVSAFHAGNKDSLAVESPDFQAALHEFHQRFYCAPHCRLVLIGSPSTDDLLALGRQLGNRLAAGEPSQRARPPAFALPEFQNWQLSLHSGSPRLWLGVALTAGVDEYVSEAVAVLAEQVGSGLAGSLADRLLRQGWSDSLRVHRLYEYAGQVLLGLEFSLADASLPVCAAIRRAVLDWLAFFTAQAPWHGLPRSGPEMAGLPPLEAGHCWLERGGRPTATLSAQGCEALRILLESVMEERLVGILAAQDLQGDARQICGFPARMLPTVWPAASTRLVFESLPSNPLLHGKSELRGPLWRELAIQPWTAGEAVLYLRCWSDTARRASWPRTLGLALRSVQAAAEPLGLVLDIRAMPAGWQLRFQGTAHVLAYLVQAVAEVIDRLVSSTSGPISPQHDGDEMPVRRLLSELVYYLDPVLDEASVIPLDPCSSLRWQGLLLGLDEEQRERLGGALLALPGRPAPGRSRVRLKAGRHWHHLPASRGDSALLVFCPVAGRLPEAEAAWRLLARYFQPAFYQRIRGDLQLGYGVFCSFHQLDGHSGILFAVQSPSASVRDIFTEIERFLADQAAMLPRKIDADSLQLAMQLEQESAGLRTSAEQLWQAHLAGNDATWPAAVRAALRQLSHERLLAWHQALQDARGGWLVLAWDGAEGSC